MSVSHVCVFSDPRPPCLHPVSSSAASNGYKGQALVPPAREDPEGGPTVLPEVDDRLSLRFRNGGRPHHDFLKSCWGVERRGVSLGRANGSRRQLACTAVHICTYKRHNIIATRASQHHHHSNNTTSSQQELSLIHH